MIPIYKKSFKIWPVKIILMANFNAVSFGFGGDIFLSRDWFLGINLLFFGISFQNINPIQLDELPDIPDNADGDPK